MWNNDTGLHFSMKMEKRSKLNQKCLQQCCSIKQNGSRVFTGLPKDYEKYKRLIPEKTMARKIRLVWLFRLKRILKSHSSSGHTLNIITLADLDASTSFEGYTAVESVRFIWRTWDHLILHVNPWLGKSVPTTVYVDLYVYMASTIRLVRDRGEMPF